jgi:hypothetical protein
MKKVWSSPSTTPSWVFQSGRLRTLFEVRPKRILPTQSGSAHFLKNGGHISRSNLLHWFGPDAHRRQPRVLAAVPVLPDSNATLHGGARDFSHLRGNVKYRDHHGRPARYITSKSTHCVDSAFSVQRNTGLSIADRYWKMTGSDSLKTHTAKKVRTLRSGPNPPWKGRGRERVMPAAVVRSRNR